jgi:hypothetical protein
VVLQARDEQLVLSTWKQSIRIDVVVPCKVEREGSFAASYEMFARTTNSLHGTLSLTREGPDLIAASTAPGAGFALPITGKEVGEVRACPIVSDVVEGATYTREDSTTVTCEACNVKHPEKIGLTYQIIQVLTQRLRLPKARLLHLLRQVNWLPEYYYRMPHLEGICLEATPGQVSLIGADTNSLALASTALPAGSVSNWERGVLVESPLLTKALRPLPQAEVCLEAVLTLHCLVQRGGEPVADSVEPFERAAFLRLSAQQVTVTVPLMNYSIPDYRGLLPTTWTTRMTCETAALRSALQALTALNNTIECHLSNASLTLEVDHKPQPARHEVAVIEQEGPDAHIICNASYLLCALDGIAASQIALEMEGAERPIVLRPVGNNGGGDYVLALQYMKKQE